MQRDPGPLPVAMCRRAIRGRRLSRVYAGLQVTTIALREFRFPKLLCRLVVSRNSNPDSAPPATRRAFLSPSLSARGEKDLLVRGPTMPAGILQEHVLPPFLPPGATQAEPL